MKTFSKFLPVPVVVVGAFLLSSCLSRNLAEPNPKVTPDPESISVEAEFTTAEDSVKVVRITANRSWYLHLNDGTLDPKNFDDTLKWAYLKLREHVNMTRVSDKIDVPIVFHRNKTEEAREATLDIWSSGTKIAQVKLVQKAAQFRLNATVDKTDITCDADTAIIHIDCNTDWTARVVEATADVKLSTEKGFDPTDLEVRFADNLDPQTVKTAKVEISARGCSPREFSFTQQKAAPYLRVSPKNTGLVPAGDAFALVELETNIEDISAEAVGGNIKVSSFERMDLKTFKVIFSNPADDPKVLGKATVRFTPNGVSLPAVEYTFSQSGGLTWRFYSETEGLNVFGLPMAKPGASVNPSKAMNPLVTSTGDEYVLYQYGYVYGRSNNSWSGIVINTTGRILFPAIEGYVLKKVRIEYRQHSSFPGTKDRIAGVSDLSFNGADNTASFSLASAYYTGLFDVAAFTKGSNVIHTFVLGAESEGETASPSGVTPPEPGAYYCLNHTARNCIIWNISLFYEPAPNQSNQ